jgi:uncharacterized OB-fold protein
MSGKLSQALPGDHVHIGMDTWTEPFWQAAKEEKLTACQCGNCGTFRMPPTPYCPECQSQKVEWPALPGTATIYSFAVCDRSPFPDVPDFVYIPIIVEMDGAPGVRLVSNLIGADPTQVAIGQKITVAWNDISEGWKQPVFRLL